MTTHKIWFEHSCDDEDPHTFSADIEANTVEAAMKRAKGVAVQATLIEWARSEVYTATIRMWPDGREADGETLTIAGEATCDGSAGANAAGEAEEEAA